MRGHCVRCQMVYVMGLYFLIWSEIFMFWFQYFTNIFVTPFVSGPGEVGMWGITRFPLFVPLCMQWKELRVHLIQDNRGEILFNNCIFAFQFTSPHWLPDDNAVSFVKLRRCLVNELFYGMYRIGLNNRSGIFSPIVFANTYAGNNLVACGCARHIITRL